MIGGGIQEVDAVKNLQKAGFKIGVVDKDPKCKCFEFADYKINCDATDIKAITSWILFNKKKIPINGIFTLINQAFTVAAVSDICGLEAIKPEKVLKFDNKIFMKNFLKKNKFLTPKFKIISSLTELKYFIKDNRNYYLKVPDSNGGRGIKKVDKKNYIKIYKSIIKEFGKKTIIAEEEIKGNFLDIQAIFYKKKFYEAGSCDSYFSNNSKKFKSYNPVEYMNVSPSQLSDATIKKSFNILKKICSAMKISFGPVGADFVIKNGKIYVIEVGPRLHGPNGSLKIMPKATGLKIIEFLAYSLCNYKNDKKINKIINKQYIKKKVAICKVFLEKKKPSSFGFRKKILYSPGVFASYTYKINKKNFTKNNLSGLASVFVFGKNLKDAEKNLDLANNFYYSKFN